LYPLEIESSERKLRANPRLPDDLPVAENPPIHTKAMEVYETKGLAERGGFEPPVEV
jgi:hypothetical protein